MKKAVAIITGAEHLLDHLGVLASILSIPLIVTDEKTYEIGKKHYPQLELIYQDLRLLTPQFLATHFDVIFVTDRLWAYEMGTMLEQLFNKKMRFVYCPHGNSDKIQRQVYQDIHLMYGQHMYDLLKSSGDLEKIDAHLFIGNFRRLFYENHPPSFISDKKTILYAPSWNDKNVLQTCDILTKELPKHYQLVIKLHPFSDSTDTSNPLIYPLLKSIDIYIGDYSSIGYDFLSFNRPMYFFQSQGPTLLHECGMLLPQNNIYQFIDETLEEQNKLSIIRQKTYQYAFGEKKDLTTLKREIETKLGIS